MCNGDPITTKIVVQAYGSEWGGQNLDEWRSLKQERTQYISRWHQQHGIYSVTVYTQRGRQKPLEIDAELGVTEVTTRTARPMDAIQSQALPARVQNTRPV